MKLITAIVRDSAVLPLQEALADAGHTGISRWNVIGRGRQHGIKVGDVVYDELAKTMLYIVAEDGEKDDVVDLIIRTAQSGDGNPGDGRIFVSDITESYTISSRSKDGEE